MQGKYRKKCLFSDFRAELFFVFNDKGPRAEQSRDQNPSAWLELITSNRVTLEFITEMVPDLIWDPDLIGPKKFCPREILSPIF